jgi:LacI family transcriptional regulator
MKHVTIKDIAKELNLAISTISRAFNNKYDIRPETKKLILDKAREMGYRSNPFARNLLQQRSMNIGIVIGPGDIGGSCRRCCRNRLSECSRNRGLPAS